MLRKQETTRSQMVRCGIGPSSHALSKKPIQLNQLMYARASPFSCTACSIASCFSISNWLLFKLKTTHWTKPINKIDVDDILKIVQSFGVMGIQNPRLVHMVTQTQEQKTFWWQSWTYSCNACEQGWQGESAGSREKSVLVPEREYSCAPKFGPADQS